METTEKITELLGHKLVKVYVGHLSDQQKTLLQEKLFSLGCVWGKDTKKVQNLAATWYYVGVDNRTGKLGWDDTEIPHNHTYKTSTELGYDELMGRLNMTFTKADLRDGMVVKVKGGSYNSDKYGKLLLVVGNSLQQATEYELLSLYLDDLTCVSHPEYDIVEVFEVVNSALPINRIQDWQLKSVWKRPEPISAQQQAILDLEAKQQELIEAAKVIASDIAKLKGK